jgi:hypothetical protein
MYSPDPLQNADIWVVCTIHIHFYKKLEKRRSSILGGLEVGDFPSSFFGTNIQGCKIAIISRTELHQSRPCHKNARVD